MTPGNGHDHMIGELNELWYVSTGKEIKIYNGKFPIIHGQVKLKDLNLDLENANLFLFPSKDSARKGLTDITDWF